MEYRLVFCTLAHTLLERVNRGLKDGWKPQGGVSVTRYDDESILYAQALIKEE